MLPPSLSIVDDLDKPDIHDGQASDILNPLSTNGGSQWQIPERHSLIDPPSSSFLAPAESIANNSSPQANELEPLDPSDIKAAAYAQDRGRLLPPPSPFFIPQRDSVTSSFLKPEGSTVNNSLHQASSLIPFNSPKGEAACLQDKGEDRDKQNSSESHIKSRSFSRLLLVLAGLLIVTVAIVLGAYFGVTRHDRSSHSGATGSSDHHSASPSASGIPGNPASTIVYGGDGTIVTTEQGTTFTYNNSFGGYFVVDPANPFNNNARANSWSPPLNQSWQFGTDQILGVNLGGWLVLEPFITPAIYQKYPDAIDEWTLHTLMAADPASGGLNQLDDHYSTFITEEDFAQIAGAGLNWVRLPIAFWAIDVWAGEPFLPKVSWKYALKAFDWARKYGIRIMLDIHATPGSQNGYNHSGQSGKVNFLNGVMGIANAQRLLHYIRIFTEFISQPQYKDIVVMLGIVNEPTGMPMAPVNSFYIEAYRIVRGITGIGAGHGPYISVQGGSPELASFQGADRIALEQHPYFAFDNQGSEDVVPYIIKPCTNWKDLINGTQQSFGVTTTGEFSLGFNDCGLMLHSTADLHTTKNCTPWDLWEDYTPTQKANLKQFAMSSMDALQHWFFWTWKIGPSAVDNSPRSPLWSYKLGLDNGWIPSNPHDAFGTCSSLGIVQDSPFNGTYQAYQTGGPGADGTINIADLANFGQWPPTSIGLVANAALLPTYTATGPVPTLSTEIFPTPTFRTATFSGGDGWFDAADNAAGIITVAGCPYPNAWDATAAPIPSALCTGTGGARKRTPVPTPVIPSML